jgi:hypothetical protein
MRLSQTDWYDGQNASQKTLWSGAAFAGARSCFAARSARLIFTASVEMWEITPTSKRNRVEADNTAKTTKRLPVEPGAPNSRGQGHRDATIGRCQRTRQDERAPGVVVARSFFGAQRRLVRSRV